MESNEWKYAPVEMCKRLQELGVVLDTEKYWVRAISTVNTPGVMVIVDGKETNDSGMDTSIWTKAYTPAPDVAELGKALSGYQIILTPEDGWQVFKPDGMAHGFLKESMDDKPEAEARCSALIWLIENDEINPEDLKL